MFLCYIFWDILGNFLYGWQSIYLRFLVYLLKISEKLMFYILMLFQSFHFLILDVSDVVVHSSLDSSAMKKTLYFLHPP